VDATGRIVREDKVASEPDVLIGWFRGLGFAVTRIGLEAGPLSQWLYAGMRDRARRWTLIFGLAPRRKK
jgi:transposase